MHHYNLDELKAQLTKNEWPDIQTWQWSDDSLKLEVDFFIPNTLKWFDGHFPDQAVLPGVVQVHWAGELAKKLFPVSNFQAVKRLKFKSMVLPDNQLSLKMHYKQDKQNIVFSYQDEHTEFSSGVLAFENTSHDNLNLDSAKRVL